MAEQDQHGRTLQYDPTDTWSKTITKKRVRLYGHLMRLPEEAPVRQAMLEYESPLQMARGTPNLPERKISKMISFTWYRQKGCCGDCSGQEAVEGDSEINRCWLKDASQPDNNVPVKEDHCLNLICLKVNAG